jgi:hypothetical protein
MQKIFLFMFISLFVLVPEGSFAQTNNETAIREILSSQENSWNHGNLENFMQGYWKNDSLMFIGKSGITYGWQKTLENYRKRYPDTAAMGTLTFTMIQFRPLSASFYFVVGKWDLQRSIGNIGGHFTLLVKKIKGKWLIVADHSS